MSSKTATVVSETKLGKHIVVTLLAALNLAGLDADALKRIGQRGDELKVGLIELFKKLAATFDPAAFIGAGWKIDSNDKQLPTPTTVGKFDPTKVVFRNMHRAGETSLKGETRIERHREAGNIVLGAEEFFWSWTHLNRLPEYWKRTDTGEVRYILFDATILRSPGGRRCVLCLYWYGGRWDWNYHGLGYGWRAQNMSAVLPSVPAST